MPARTTFEGASGRGVSMLAGRSWKASIAVGVIDTDENAACQRGEVFWALLKHV